MQTLYFIVGLLSTSAFAFRTTYSNLASEQ